jgi:hypothetical protein
LSTSRRITIGDVDTQRWVILARLSLRCVMVILNSVSVFWVISSHFVPPGRVPLGIPLATCYLPLAPCPRRVRSSLPLAPLGEFLSPKTSPLVRSLCPLASSSRPRRVLSSLAPSPQSLIPRPRPVFRPCPLAEFLSAFPLLLATCRLPLAPFPLASSSRPRRVLSSSLLAPFPLHPAACYLLPSLWRVPLAQDESSRQISLSSGEFLSPKTSPLVSSPCSLPPAIITSCS